MDESLIKSRLLYFIIPLIVCMLLGYLSHDLISGIRSGIAIGIGFLIGRELVGKHWKRSRLENANGNSISITSPFRRSNAVSSKIPSASFFIPKINTFCCCGYICAIYRNDIWIAVTILNMRYKWEKKNTVCYPDYFRHLLS